MKVSCNLKDNNKPLLFTSYLFFENFSFIEGIQKDFHNRISSLICKLFSCDQWCAIHHPVSLKQKFYLVSLKLFLDKKNSIGNLISCLCLYEIPRNDLKIQK